MGDVSLEVEGTGASLGAHRVKNPPANAGDPDSIPGSRIFLGDGHDYPLQYFCLENSMDWEPWWPTVHRVTKSRT